LRAKRPCQRLNVRFFPNSETERFVELLVRQKQIDESLNIGAAERTGGLAEVEDSPAAEEKEAETEEA
jgi:hypothetical protein